MPCPLCLSGRHREYWQDDRRVYKQCAGCELVFVPEQYHLTSEAELAEYKQHQNSPLDKGYRRFLSRLVEPLEQNIDDCSTGLDFGCGPGPTLSIMLEELGHSVVLYDKFFYKNEQVWAEQYDFISATEVWEHLKQPGEEIKRLWACLKPGGVLGVMTKLVIDKDAFSRWHYKNDPTHICFFSKPSLNWLATELGAELRFYANDTFILKKVCR